MLLFWMIFLVVGTRISQHFGKAGFRLVKGDVRNEADVKRALERVDAVFQI